MARVPVPDKRFDTLVASYKPKSVVPAVLTITDIAGLVRGASEGKGLGNAFLSHIRACDAIYEVVRCFADKEVTHVEGSIDPARDIDIIREELLKKDQESVRPLLPVLFVDCQGPRWHGEDGLQRCWWQGEEARVRSPQEDRGVPQQQH